MEEFRSLGGEMQGGPAEGTAWAATPLGRVEASYEYDGEHLTVTVTKAPVMLPVGMIWERLDRICGPPVARA